MNKAYLELKKVGVFYISTVDNDMPRVRPFGAICLFEDNLYICTNNTKNFYKQIMINPNVEITALYPGEGECWMRMQARVYRDDRDVAREVMLNENPGLRQMYSIGDGIFEVLRLDNIKCSKYSFVRDVEVIC